MRAVPALQSGASASWRARIAGAQSPAAMLYLTLQKKYGHLSTKSYQFFRGNSPCSLHLQWKARKKSGLYIAIRSTWHLQPQTINQKSPWTRNQGVVGGEFELTIEHEELRTAANHSVVRPLCVRTQRLRCLQRANQKLQRRCVPA